MSLRTVSYKMLHTYIYIYMYIWYGIYPCEVMSRGMWTIKWSSVGSRWAFLLPRRCFVMLCKLPLFHPEVIWRVKKHKVRKTISRQPVLIVLYHFMTHTMEPWFESTNKSSVNGKVWHFGQYTYSLSCWELYRWYRLFHLILCKTVNKHSVKLLLYYWYLVN